VRELGRTPPTRDNPRRKGEANAKHLIARCAEGHSLRERQAYKGGRLNLL
jgi:hypothetical protein